jgi:hypothetical protein
VDEGGLKTVKNVMETNGREAVQQIGCCTLWTLLRNESSYAKAIVDAGCVNLVISAMNDHPMEAMLQEYGCKFLSQVSQAHAKYRFKIPVGGKGWPDWESAMRPH